MLQKALSILLGVSISKAIRLISRSRNGNQPVAIAASSEDDVILTSPPATKYDVFLSFRGEDTRHNFASYLYKGLRNAGIHTFMDHELRKGESISPILQRTIGESEISVIIFFENYASSTWCLDELVHILECKRKFGRVVIPVFYNVDPSSIRKQNGNFGKGFDVLEQRFKDNPEALQKWRNALIQSTNLSGWDSHSTRPEFKLIEEIVKDILRKLNYASSSHLEGLIGIARHFRNIQRLLIEARIVGIWGMGGAGKTTLAKAILQGLKAQFDAFSFIENVKEQLKRISLEKKILLILDDVDNSIVAADLTKVLDWFGEGSRIIITSRDMQVLKNASATSSTYHVPDLDFEGAFHLFNLKAFKRDEPSKGYMELSKSVVKYCHGNPLALLVLGCFLYGRQKEEWESALEKLNQSPPKDIVDVLKLSFDGLDDKQQNVFLDLAFLIKQGVHISLNLLRQLYCSSMHIEISVLREKSLISFNNHNNFIEMHDLLREMGLEISSQQLYSSRKTLVRLWRHEDIYHFFHNDQAVEAIRCMSLDASKIESITLMASHFRRMHYLMSLQVYKSNQGKPSKLNICKSLDYLSKELRFLNWEEYPLPFVPLQFCAKNLIELELPNSNIQQLWDQVMVCSKIMYGIGFKHVKMPLKETAEVMTMGIQSLATLLPFVRIVECVCFAITVRMRGDRGKRGVEDDKEEDEDKREMISENEREMSSKGDQVGEMTLLLKEDEQEEADEDDSKMDDTLLTTLLIPNTIPRWSLLIRLTLKEGDSIGNNNAGCSSIPQVSIFRKSLNEDCRARIQPLLGVQLSSPISPLPHHSFGVFYNYSRSTLEHPHFLVFESGYRSSDYFCGNDLFVRFGNYW
ncbi:disease resistance-like protein DSC1 [Neltuma alba]|uniref:disease resistance-like protein DSC1 n=1 Tax=Neltuma alba TaxID=207710 RepID=UPI0010A50845|nr:disease resistance-like protein DSC1 [Prosopis alba]